jgi:hypothetical protein
MSDDELYPAPALPIRERLAKLGEFCTAFEDEDFWFGEWSDAEEVSPGVFQRLHFILSATAQAWLQHCCDGGWVRNDADWNLWMISEEAYTLMYVPDAIAKATASQLGKLLTVVVRQSRLVEGSLEDAFDSELLLDILRRARELAVSPEIVEEEPAGRGMMPDDPINELGLHSRRRLLSLMERHCWKACRNDSESYVKDRLRHWYDPDFVMAKFVLLCFYGTVSHYEMLGSLEINDETFTTTKVVRALMCLALSEGMGVPFDRLADRVAEMGNDDFGHVAAHRALANYCHLHLVSRVGNILADLLLRPDPQYGQIKSLIRITRELLRMKVNR